MVRLQDTRLSYILSYICTIVPHFLISSANALPPHSTPLISPELVCSFTPFPKFCISELKPKGLANIYDHARHAVHHSYSATRNFHATIRNYLNTPDTLSHNTIYALQDCLFLSRLNEDFLEKTDKMINSTNALQSMEVEDVQTYLSATITNHETCSDGLKDNADKDSNIRNVVRSAVVDGSRSHSVSLALFLHGWGKNVKHTTLGRFLTEEQDKLVTKGNRTTPQTTYKEKVIRERVVVNPNGSADFTAISDAVGAAPNNTVAGDGYFLICVVGGVYEEYVTIGSNKRYIMMVGDGINQTIITGNRNVADGWTTFNSATFVVTGQGFVGINMTIRNTAGAVKHQAVAVRNGADLSTFYKCSFEGYQDTLYTHSLRQYYRECDIYGTIDFIFGNAAVVLQNCNLYPRLPLSNQFNAVTAQGRTDINQNTGTCIHNCNIVPSLDLSASLSGNGTTQTYLGRPWKEYSRTVYVQSYMDGIINKGGWIAWSGDFALNSVYYAEYDNRGSGSVTTERVTWQGYHPVISATDASNFTVSNFIQGNQRLNNTCVPYTPGLL
ncbi:esterase [Lithospermum erythrorhizon]|uniref:Pectinesterase n=1 Tax=Lithospermum erythrorhizon TaxID=34254 RepID=A0AAV3P5Y5_LITER